MNRSPTPIPTARVMWIVWLCLTTSMFIYQQKLGGGWPAGKDARSALEYPILWFAIGNLVGAFVVRWWFLPAQGEIRRMLVLLIIGMALSEAVVFFEIFLFPRDMPETKRGLFILALVSALQFVPLYTRRALLTTRAQADNC